MKALSKKFLICQTRPQQTIKGSTNLQVPTVRKSCSNAENMSRKSLESYPHLKSITDKLHLSGGAVDLLIGADFVEIHAPSGDAGEPLTKINCFGWYILGEVSSDTEVKSHSISGCQNSECCG